MKKQLPIAVVIAALVTLILDFAIELIAPSLQPWFEERQWLLYLILAGAFAASLGASLYIMRHGTDESVTGIKINQSASGGGQIKNSPITTNADSQAHINQSAHNRGKIEDSGITIE